MERRCNLRGMKRSVVSMLVLVGLLAWPQAAWANAGTALMQSALWHLIVGNAIIGVLEGSFLRVWFKGETHNTTVSMIAANYVSAWVGGFLVCGWVARSIDMNLNNGWAWFWGMVGLSYMVTIVLEWPFVAYCFKGARQWVRRSIQATLLVQTVSYVLLFGWYWLIGGTSLYTKMEVVDPSEIRLPPDVDVYYIGQDDGHIHRRSLATGVEETVVQLGSTNQYDRLMIRPAQADSNRWDLLARLDARSQWDVQTVPILTNLIVGANDDHDLGHSSRLGPVPQIGSATNSAWQFKTRVWATPGMIGENRSTGERVQLSWETLYAIWSARNAVHLPTDKVLFQLGRDQICVFDPATKQVALLCRGRGPVAVVSRHVSF
jgi:hypothetical protein